MITESSVELVHAYDPLLFVGSVVIAAFGGYVALGLIDRVGTLEGEQTGRRWLAGASAAMGVGIWGMHFTGMLALRLPVPVGYEPGLTLLSGGIAILVSLFAFVAVRRERVAKRELAAASAVMGGAIGGMHYTGMAAMRLPGEMFYRSSLVVASLVVGVLASGTALWLFLRHRDRGGKLSPLHRGKVAGGVLLGLAVSGLHYTAMAAARFRDLQPDLPLPGEGLLLTDSLALWVGLGSLGLLGVGLLAALMDRRLQRAYTEELRESQRRYESLLTEISDVVTVLDGNGIIRYQSPSIEKIFGYDSEELVGRSAFDLVHPEDVDRVREEFVELLAAGEEAAQYRFRHGDGSWRLVESTGVTPRNGGYGGPHVVTRDISERVAAQQKYRAIFETTPSAVGVSSLEDGRFVDVNPAFEELFGYDRDEVVGSTSAELGVWAEPRKRERVAERVRNSGVVQNLEVQFRDARGEVVDVLFSGTVLEVSDESYLLGVAKDITERKQFEEALEHQALHDQLTGLPNRTLFSDRLTHALQRFDRAGEQAALLYLDLDGFKAVNDSRGHAAGDRVLEMVADRLLGTLREEDTVARIGGDEFAVLLEDVASPEDVERAVARIQAIFDRSFEIEDTAYSLTASIGVAHTGLDIEEPEELVRRADAAMYRAKRSSGTDIHVFDPEQDRELTERR